jgi:hypothetical protein
MLPHQDWPQEWVLGARRHSSAICDMDVATDRSESSHEIWKASHSHALDWPMPGEGRSPNSPADGEDKIVAMPITQNFESLVAIIGKDKGDLVRVRG